MDLKDFNLKLASYINDAKLMERTDPAKAKILWVKIAEFALEFSKQPNIDRDFRMKLWKQIDGILKRAKEGMTKNGIKIEKTQEKSGKESKSVPFLPSKMPEDDEKDKKDENNSLQEGKFDFDDLPSVPEDEPNQSIQKNNDEEMSNSESFFSKIQKMEEELKKIPDSFKEIKPKPFSSEKTIIPPSNLPKPNVGPQVNIDINSEGKGLLDDNPVNFNDDSIDPYKGTKDTDEIKDPFAKTPEKDDISIKKLSHCYACGTQIEGNNKTCPKCGAELK
ncbi:MAG: zinc ribbon domain-containing protein [archaeon]|nr:zinc ribbon domain-containing protein [archaeon]